MQTVSIEELFSQHQTLSALQMHQVWAECVFLGKDIENRNRRICKRGTILIYACATQESMKDSLRTLDERPALRSLLRDGFTLSFGALLGAVDVVDCTDNTHSDEWVGDWGMPRSFHWHLSNPRRFAEPIFYKPKCQGWFYITADLLEKDRDCDV